ncbi:MAG TPA: Uma2 family endonuclease [Pirellulales bacterium]|nr:Uma2 family endonuclease [Pirellulales bacterium]
MSISLPPLPGAAFDPLYPDSDGKPMGETEIHVIAIFDLYHALRRHFRHRQDVHVAADMFLYYEQGNPRACKAPDVMVSKGVRGKHPRRSFRVWEENAVPAVAFEVTSLKSRREDATEKPRAYAEAGIAEYFIFDPLDEYLKPRLQGFRLGPNGYEALPLDDDGRLTSQQLGLFLKPEEALLRLFDIQTGAALPSLDELDEQADAERRRADALEEELKRLRGRN